MSPSNPTWADPALLADLTADLIAELRSAGCVFAEEEAALLLDAAKDPDQLRRLTDERIAGRPLEQLLGWVDFGGLRLQVADGVFVPRQRTLALAERAAGLVRPGHLLLDLCCGVGAIAAYVAHREPGLAILAADLQPQAVACARANLLGYRAETMVGDLYAPVPSRYRGRVDVLTANVPYVPTSAIATMPPEARDHEPRAALGGGDDGLDVARRVIAGAADWLSPHGRLLIETSAAQVAAASTFAAAHGLSATPCLDEERETTVMIFAHS